MSADVKSFLHEKGVPTSRSTPYHPTGNSQCERFVGIVWKTICLALESKDMPIRNWEHVLPDALHSLRSLLCTSTNATPHERMFNFSRKTSTGMSMPSWLVSPGRVLLKKHVRNKDDPFVQEVELLEANPQYAHVKFPNGREDTVALRDLAPAGEATLSEAEKIKAPENVSLENTGIRIRPPPADIDPPENLPENSREELTDQRFIPYDPAPTEINQSPFVPRRSSRIRKQVVRYGNPSV